MIGVIPVVHLPADDLAAVQVQDQIQVEPAPLHLRRQVGHVPAPHLARRGGDMRGGRPDRLGRLGAPAAGGLPVRPQHPAEAGFAGQVYALIGQHGHDARRRHGGKARLVGHGSTRALGLAQGMAGCRSTDRGRRHPHQAVKASTAARCAARFRRPRRQRSTARLRRVQYRCLGQAWRSSRTIIRPRPC